MKKKFLMILLSTFTLLMAINVKAETTKDIQVPISKNYTTAKFEMNFEYYDDYSIVVKSPSGKTYDAEYKGNNLAECIVNDTEIGQYEVIISKPDTENTDTEIKDEENREISKVKIQVEGSSDSLVDVDKNIVVATDIVGLKMYFKDDDFVAEWTDTSCGNVNVDVVNAKNLQKLDSQTVSDCYYSFALDDTIEEIMVSIVPAVSANIDGAAKTYTYKVGNHPDAVVTYEDKPVTNQDTIKVSCNMKDSYGVKILVNDNEVKTTDLLGAGEHEFDVPLDIGSNHVVTYIVDKDGNMKSTVYDTIKDVVAPNLSLVSDYKDIVTSNEYLTIEGAVDDCDYLTINDTEIKIGDDNKFSFDYKLQDGNNNIVVAASDVAGNMSKYEFSVTKEVKKSDGSLIQDISVIIAALFLFLVVIGLLKRNKKTGTRIPEKNENKEMAAEPSNMPHIEKSDDKIRKENKKIKVDKKWIDKIKKSDRIRSLVSIIVPLVILYVILTYVIMVSCVSSGSMEPTLKVGNTAIYNRLAYMQNDPERGDIVVFYSEEYNKLFAKRIIGLPGDHIQFRDGYVVINDQYCKEDYLDKEIETNCTKEFTVPDNCYFMLGDNREKSNDSRYWKNPYIVRNDILGKYMGQYDFSIQYDILNKKTQSDI